jgi:hypothetical protein
MELRGRERIAERNIDRLVSFHVILTVLGLAYNLRIEFRTLRITVPYIRIRIESKTLLFDSYSTNSNPGKFDLVRFVRSPTFLIQVPAAVKPLL